MALAKHERVEIPPHCVRVPNGNNVYIHYTLRAYRNEKGQPTSERVSIGKLDSETGMLIPNNRYYELFEKRAPLPMLEYVRDYGVYAAFRGVVSELGLDKLLKKHFPDHAEEMLTVAQYMLSEGNVMYYLPDWQEEKLSYTHTALSSGSLSRLFVSTGSKARIDFFNDWMKKRKPQEFRQTFCHTFADRISNCFPGERERNRCPINLFLVSNLCRCANIIRINFSLWEFDSDFVFSDVSQSKCQALLSS